MDIASFCVSIVALALSAFALWWEIDAIHPRAAFSFTVHDAGASPGFRNVLGSLLVSNVGRCAFSVRAAGILLPSGEFLRNDAGPSLPLALRPGESAKIDVVSGSAPLLGRSFAVAVELEDGRSPHILGAFVDLDDFARNAPGERSRAAERGALISGRLRRMLVVERKRIERNRKQREAKGDLGRK